MRLMPLLWEALRRQRVLPKREIGDLGASLTPQPGWRTILDGTGCLARRPKNPEK